MLYLLDYNLSLTHDCVQLSETFTSLLSSLRRLIFITVLLLMEEHISWINGLCLKINQHVAEIMLRSSPRRNIWPLKCETTTCSFMFFSTICSFFHRTNWVYFFQIYTIRLLVMLFFSRLLTNYIASDYGLLSVLLHWPTCLKTWIHWRTLEDCTI